ncbi:MAG: hypothetical protein PHX70_09825 [Clostridium sp.]|nr:hypothetical protein [Clostridium sp.]
MSTLDNFSPNELALIASVVAIIISDGKSADDLNVLGIIISSIGSNISLIAAQRQFIQSKEDKIKQIQDLQNQIKTLKKDL